MSKSIKNTLWASILFYLSGLTTWGDTEQCLTVRMADIGWTDVSATTAVAENLLITLKYQPKVLILSLPVSLAALKNHDLDIFLGNWMPTQEADIRPFLNEKSVVQVHKNLTGAKFSLAVPDYVYQAGVKNFADLAKHSDKFGNKIYGIEAGNDGNRLIAKLISDQAFGLNSWHLVESSEQAMLVEVGQAIKEQRWIVFLAWAPHPMNLKHQINYLAGGDNYFGPNFGASEVFTLSRTNLASECPDLAQFFSQLTFTIEQENQLMQLILEQQLSPDQAASKWLEQNPEQVKIWLSGIKNAQGDPADQLFASSLRSQVGGLLQLPDLSIGSWIEAVISFINQHFSRELRVISLYIEKTVSALVNLILKIYWPLIIFAFVLLAQVIHRSWRLSLSIALGFLLIIYLALWKETIQTLILVSLASLISILIGLPIGILAARKAKFYNILRPILDLMQTIPTFVYLIPTLMLFGLGLVPGLISTVIFAIAAPIRLTYLGIKAVPQDLLEAGLAFGATPMQRLVKIEIPSALPSIMAGFSQCIMLSLSMVVIAAMVGAEGLGAPVVRALNTVNIRLGFESGLAIVILAIILDRLLSFKTCNNS